MKYISTHVYIIIIVIVIWNEYDACVHFVYRKIKQLYRFIDLKLHFVTRNSELPIKFYRYSSDRTGQISFYEYADDTKYTCSSTLNPLIIYNV